MDIKNGLAYFDERELRLLGSHGIPNPLPLDELGVLALESALQAERTNIDQFRADCDTLGPTEQITLSGMRTLQEQREKLMKTFLTELEIDQTFSKDIGPDDIIK